MHRSGRHVRTAYRLCRHKIRGGGKHRRCIQPGDRHRKRGLVSDSALSRLWDGATKAAAAVAGAWSWLWVASMLRNLAYTFRDPRSPLHGVNMSHPFWSALWFQALVFIALAGLAIYSAWNWWCDNA